MICLFCLSRMLCHLPSLNQTNASSSTALASSSTSLTRMVVICRRCTFQEHICFICVQPHLLLPSQYVQTLLDSTTLSAAAPKRYLMPMPHTLCVSSSKSTSFDRYDVTTHLIVVCFDSLPLLYFTRMHTHIAVVLVNCITLPPL